MASQHNSIKHLEDHISLEFPAFLTHRADVDLKLADMLSPLFDSSGMSANAVARMLKELHMKKYHQDFIAFESEQKHNILQY